MGLKPGLAIWLCLRAIAWPNWSIILDNALSRGCYRFTNLCSKRYWKKPTKQDDEKNPKMMTKRNNKKEWVRERVRESTVFAQRFALVEHEVRQWLTEGAELNFHYCARSRGARVLPWTTWEGGLSCTPATDRTGCTLAKGSENWWETLFSVPCTSWLLVKMTLRCPRCWLVSCWEEKEEEGRKLHLCMCHTLAESLRWKHFGTVVFQRDAYVSEGGVGIEEREGLSRTSSQVIWAVRLHLLAVSLYCCSPALAGGLSL